MVAEQVKYALAPGQHLLSKSPSGSDNRRSVYSRNATLIASCAAGAAEDLRLSLIKMQRFTKAQNLFYTHSVSLYVSPGKDVATNVEVYWPDGRSVARPLEPSDINSVLEIRYPKDEDEVTPTAEIQVHCCSGARRGKAQCCEHFQVLIF